MHKNIPSVNTMLQEVKHLVTIRPLTFPHGLPEHESDFEHMYIKPTGEAIVKKRLEAYEPESIESDASASHMQQETLKKYLDRMRLEHTIHTEYHRTKYTYKKNEDGKEFRYNHNKDNLPYGY